MTPKDVLDMAKENGAKVVDLRFMDFPGLWQHFTVPISELKESSFEDGFGFDGSSIRGWQPIHASDMLVVPDATTAKMDPFYEAPTLVLICNIVDPVTREAYTRDPRNIAQKADAYLKSSGIGDVAYFGPEAEFFIFDDIRFESTRYAAFYEIDSVEGNWNTGRDEGPNLGYKPRHKEGYFPVPPMDKFQDLRTEMLLTLENLGIEIEAQHHEVATAGQAEIDMRFKPLLQMSDQLMWFKYVLKNVAYRHNHTVTFMPKPLFEDNGTGMHTHISIWKDDQPL
ncbi:MAG: glutamine synthetase beta-grasp domain-containing protein, partial [Desulfobacterales bacterium]